MDEFLVSLFQFSELIFFSVVCADGTDAFDRFSCRAVDPIREPLDVLEIDATATDDEHHYQGDDDDSNYRRSGPLPIATRDLDYRPCRQYRCLDEYLKATSDIDLDLIDVAGRTCDETCDRYVPDILRREGLDLLELSYTEFSA